MKRRNILISSLALFSLLSFTSCNSGKVADLNKGDAYFTREATEDCGSAYIDMNNVPKKISFKIKLSGSIEYVSIGTRVKLYEESFSYKDGILTLDCAELMENGKLKLTAGEHNVKIKCKTLMTTKLLVVTKVIKTASELQEINKNPSGSYILGNDIDCSEISNFEPLGYAESDSHFQQEFLGVFDGNGYSIKNVNIRYSTNMASSEALYKGQALFSDESHREGTNYGIFQAIGNGGQVRNTSFVNCKVYAKTIAGVIAGQNSGTIKNCYIAPSCEARISTHYYDDWCNVGVIAGLNNETGKIQNVISQGIASIEPTFIDYLDDYIEEDGVNNHTFYGEGKTIFTDSNGDNGCGVYAGVGMNIGQAENSYAASFKINTTNKIAYFGQTHLYANVPSDGDDMGSFTNCEVKTADQMKSIALYDTFSTDVWNIYDGSIPTFKAIYPIGKY